MISQGAVASQTSKATSWLYLGISGTADNVIDRGSLIRCDANETNSLNYLNNNYPASNYAIGYVVQVLSITGTFPNTTFCTARYFKAV